MEKHNYITFKIEPGAVRVSTFDIHPPENWKVEDHFPSCCDFHSSVVKATEAFLQRFPLCCEEHTTFARLFRVKREEYFYLKEKIVRLVSYTEKHISNVYENEDWYEDITDYFELNLFSLGQPVIGGVQYCEALKHWIKKSTSKLSPEQRHKLTRWFEEQEKPTTITKSADINILNQLYQNWLDAFPFNLSFFQKAKEHFKDKNPFIAQILRTNRYTGFTKAVLHTEDSMVEYLHELTRSLLSYIKTDELLKQGIITDLEKTSIDLIFQQHDFNRKTLLNEYNKGERRYLGTIKAWLKNENEFFKSLKSINKKSLPFSTKTIKRKNKSIVSFQPNYGKEEIIRSIIRELDREFYLINDRESSVDDFLTILLAKHATIDKKIYFGCYTNQLALIIDQFKACKLFNGLSYAALEKAGIFYSKEGTKITGQLISSSKNQGPIPDRQEEILAIFNKFQ